MRRGLAAMWSGCVGVVWLGLGASACGGPADTADALAQRVVAAVGAEDVAAAAVALTADEDTARAAFERSAVSGVARAEALARLPRVVSRNRVRVRASIERVRTQLDSLGLDAKAATVGEIEVDRRESDGMEAARVRVAVSFPSSAHTLDFYAAKMDGRWLLQGPIDWRIPEFSDPFHLGTELTHELYDLVEANGGDVAMTTAAAKGWLAKHAARLATLDAALERTRTQKLTRVKSDNRHPFREKMAEDLQTRTQRLAASFPEVMADPQITKIVARLLPPEPKTDGHEKKHEHKPGDGHKH